MSGSALCPARRVASPRASERFCWSKRVTPAAFCAQTMLMLVGYIGEKGSNAIYDMLLGEHAKTLLRASRRLLPTRELGLAPRPGSRRILPSFHPPRETGAPASDVAPPAAAASDSAAPAQAASACAVSQARRAREEEPVLRRTRRRVAAESAQALPDEPSA